MIWLMRWNKHLLHEIQTMFRYCEWWQRNIVFTYFLCACVAINSSCCHTKGLWLWITVTGRFIFSDTLNQAFKAFLIFWSVLYCDKAYTAHMVAGSQPNRVICKIKQIRPANGLPMVKNVNHGKNNAISNLILRLSLSYYSSDIIA